MPVAKYLFIISMQLATCDILDNSKNHYPTNNIAYNANDGDSQDYRTYNYNMDIVIPHNKKNILCLMII